VTCSIRVAVLTALVTAALAAPAGLGGAAVQAAPTLPSVRFIPAPPMATSPVSIEAPPAVLQDRSVTGGSDGVALWGGRLTSTVAPATGAWPLRPRPRVVGDFAPPETRWGAGHRGVDLAGHPGQTVRSARAGIVTFAGRIAGRGVVVVSHGSTRTTYEPVSADVDVGDVVDEGAPLGRLERFGSHCFPRACLHWGLIRGEAYLDPLTLVGAGRVRLLPWSERLVPLVP
jgi:murein DD-endopeptidase MepM/ murein hydrolase activator NlpD